jgi:hypothetical protein
MNYFIKLILTTILVFVINCTSLYAHPGHGHTDGHSLIHYLMEPMHAMIFGAVVLMIAFSSTYLILKMKKRAKENA